MLLVSSASHNGPGPLSGPSRPPISSLISRWRSSVRPQLRLSDSQQEMARSDRVTEAEAFAELRFEIFFWGGRV